MKQLPIIPKIIINIFLYVLYFVMGCVLAAVIIYGVFGYIFAFAVPKDGDPVFDKIAIAVAVVVFIISLVLRKYFYISLSSEK